MQEFGISAGLQMCCCLQLGEPLSKSEKNHHGLAPTDFKHANILLPCVAGADERDEMKKAKVYPDCENGVSGYCRGKRKLGGEVMNEVTNQRGLSVSFLFFSYLLFRKK